MRDRATRDRRLLSRALTCFVQASAGNVRRPRRILHLIVDGRGDDDDHGTKSLLAGHDLDQPLGGHGLRAQLLGQGLERVLDAGANESGGPIAVRQ